MRSHSFSSAPGPCHLTPLARCAAVLALAGAAMGTAHAQGLYVGGSLGKTDYTDSINGGGTGGNGVSGKLYAGYELLPNLALEAGFVGLGHADGGLGRVRGRGGFADVVGLLPLTPQWSLLGRLGAARLKVDTGAGNDTGSALKLGLGGQYTLSQRLALRGEWERYRVDVFNGKPKVNQYTLGVNVRF